jgi:hypothetical protein
MYFNLLEKQEQVKTKISQCKEIIQIRAKINELQNKKSIQRVNEMKFVSLKR